MKNKYNEKKIKKYFKNRGVMEGRERTAHRKANGVPGKVYSVNKTLLTTHTLSTLDCGHSSLSRDTHSASGPSASAIHSASWSQGKVFLFVKSISL